MRRCVSACVFAFFVGLFERLIERVERMQSARALDIPYDFHSTLGIARFEMRARRQ